jgi:hypothetical protein
MAIWVIHKFTIADLRGHADRESAGEKGRESATGDRRVSAKVEL